MRRLALALAFPLALLAAGCSSGSQVGGAVDANFPNHTAAEILTILGQQVPTVERFTAESDADVRTPQRSGSVGTSLRGTADSVLVQVRATLGIDVARVLVTADSFHVAASVNDRYYYGPVAVAEQYLPGASSLEGLKANLLGLVRPDPARTWSVLVVDSTYVLSSVGETTLRYTVDPRIWRVTDYRETTSEGHELVRGTFSRFAEVNGTVVARRVELVSGVYDSAVRFDHDRIDLQPAQVRIRFVVPADYGRRPLQ